MIKVICNHCNKEVDNKYIEVKHNNFVFHYCNDCLIKFCCDRGLTLNFFFTFLEKQERNEVKRRIK